MYRRLQKFDTSLRAEDLSGELETEKLNHDAEILNSFYHNTGYIQARVGEPVVEYRGVWIYITFNIEEGARFKVGKVDIRGDLLQPREELIEKLRISRQTYYNREVVRRDMLGLTDLHKCYWMAQGHMMSIGMSSIISGTMTKMS